MFKTNTKSTKSSRRTPLKAPPLRAPGESLRREIDEILGGKLNDWAMFGALGWSFCAIEVIRLLWNNPATIYSCILMAICATIMTLIALRKILGIRKQIRTIRQGMQGEQVVGQYLEEYCCRPLDYRVYHDLVAENFNIDHILVGPGGIYVLETKTISKPVVGSPVVTYEGQTVKVDGYSPERDPIAQVKGAAAHVRQLLTESTGRQNLPIRPVVLYPGWYIEGSLSGKEVWVLEPKALPKFLEREPVRFSNEDIHLFASRLAEHIRERERASVANAKL